MRRTQEGFVPFKDDKAKDTENSQFEAPSVLVAKANLKPSAIICAWFFVMYTRF